MSEQDEEDAPKKAHPNAVTEASESPRLAHERRPALVFLRGELLAVPIPLERDEVTLGRALEADVRVNDPRVSRHHAQITFRHSHYLLRDQRSTNGTFVNNQPIETVVLASGDRVSIGGFELIFHQE